MISRKILKIAVVLVLLIVSASYNISNTKQSKIGYAIGIVNEIAGYCRVSELVIAKEVIVGSNSKAWDELMDELNQKYPVGSKGNNKYDLHTKTVVQPDQVVIIYSYQTKSMGCTSTVIRYLKAKTFEEASKNIEELKKNAEWYNFVEKKRWPSAK